MIKEKLKSSTNGNFPTMATFFNRRVNSLLFSDISKNEFFKDRIKILKSWSSFSSFNH